MGATAASAALSPEIESSDSDPNLTAGPGDDCTFRDPLLGPIAPLAQEAQEADQPYPVP